MTKPEPSLSEGDVSALIESVIETFPWPYTFVAQNNGVEIERANKHARSVALKVAAVLRAPRKEQGAVPLVEKLRRYKSSFRSPMSDMLVEAADTIEALSGAAVELERLQEHLASLAASPNGGPEECDGAIASSAEAQQPIDGLLVARMIMEFQRQLREVYGDDVMTSNLCAVGPLQSMIGLAIRNGHLALASHGQDKPV